MERGKFKSLDEIVLKIVGKRCVNCSAEFQIGNFELGFYEHEDGWFVESIGKTLWLYARCLNCDYQNALWKLENR